MAKKYNILKDEKFMKHILSELHYFCRSHQDCTYCNFHYEDDYDGNICRLSNKQGSPEEFIAYMGDED